MLKNALLQLLGKKIPTWETWCRHRPVRQGRSAGPNTTFEGTTCNGVLVLPVDGCGSTLGQAFVNYTHVQQ